MEDKWKHNRLGYIIDNIETDNNDQSVGFSHIYSGHGHGLDLRELTEQTGTVEPIWQSDLEQFLFMRLTNI